ncbi:DUF3806 domain-containing protein [Nocardioides cynanchi]|uniref:DUF3806 domain-containing protein n=1 Tax=Nocardioides cynanchi TaxID=2558918 RepID=UPI001245E63A|nr:DUF3806 domain-containing protein [Nocardioides cynanchi]
MPWFKKSSGEEPQDESPTAQAPVAQADPVLEPLTSAEVDWVRSSIAELGEQDVLFGDIDDLGRHYDEMLNAWLRLDEAHRPDPNPITNQIGLAFGQYVADQARLDWMVATDTHGTEIALHRARGNVLIYPTDLVAKRWAAHERNVIAPLARDLIATVGELP